MRQQSARRRPSRVSLQVESLEQVQLLSAGLVGGIWTLRGTGGNDTITVDRSMKNPALLRAFLNGKRIGTESAQAVQQIRLLGLDGNDTLKIDERQGSIRKAAVLRGGVGDDMLVGGSGPSQLDGGSGRDLLQGGVGRNVLRNGVATDSARRFGSVRGFRQFLARAARQQKLQGPIFRGLGPAELNPSPSSPAPPGSSQDHSKTNVQVAGVDEADIVETNGDSLFLLSRGELVIVDARQADAPKVVSRTKLDGSPLAEYLDGDRLTVLSSVWQPAPVDGTATGGALRKLRFRGQGQVQVTVFDVSDPAKPKVVQETSLDGGYADSRMVDGKLYLVTQSNLFSGFWGGPILIDTLPGRAVKSAPTDPSTLVNAPVDRILPGYSAQVLGADGKMTTRSGLLAQPQDIIMPALGDDANLMTVTVLDTRGVTPGPVGSATMLGSYASTLHVTKDNLYIFSPRWDDAGTTTNVYQFALAQGKPTFTASGSVPGQLLDQFSADEHGGYLRVATTIDRTTGADNGVYVLQKQGDRLAIVGMVNGIAPGERIFSARFLGDEAFLVTFEQVDPLWGIDLSKPTAPKVVGELELPGFSRLLLPYDEGYLLGIGRDADPSTGRTLGLKLSLFDVRDLANPTLVASQGINPPDTQWNWSNAEWDAHALGFFPEMGVVAIPVEGWGPTSPVPPGTDPGDVTWKSESDLYVFRVDTTKGFTSLGKVQHDSTATRSIRIGDVIYSIADQDVQTVRVGTTLTKLGSVTIQTETSGWGDFGILPVPLLAAASPSR